MILAGEETQQDVEQEDVDRVNTHLYGLTQAHTHTQTHAHIARMYMRHYITSSSDQWYALLKIQYDTFHRSLGFCKGIGSRKRHKPTVDK